MAPLPPSDDDAALARKRKVRNWAMLIVLVGISVLFFLITLAKLHRAG
jgi:hypothetical protein